ncbi:MAG: FecR domain-containing protein [Bacteroidales bacterium]|nr:FecR domain-containing protein [Bacteroidales bacterium]
MENIGIDRVKQLLLLHLMHDLDENQEKELDDWRKASDENEELFRRMSDPNYLSRRHQDYLKVLESGRSASESGGKSRRFLWWALGLAAAAAIAIAVLVPGLWNVKMITVNAPQKGIASLVLPDGSKVWMKSSSSITYPERFAKESREVSFTGEGYFEVSGDDSIPFVVDCDAFKVKVTGTKFDIKSYRDDKQALAALIEGEVAILYADSTGADKVDKMVGGDLSIFDKTSRTNTVVKSNTSIYSSWIGGVYSFDSETLENILREVCRYYGYNLIVADSCIKDKVLSGRLQMGDDAENIISAFQDFLPGRIKLESDTIIIQ